MMNSFLKKIDWLVLPLIGAGVVLLLWQVSAATWAKELPSPLKTWTASKDYILHPFDKRGEMDQEVDEAVDSLSSLMEPMIMVILGGLIGGIVVAMYLPIFKMGQAI